MYSDTDEIIYHIEEMQTEIEAEKPSFIEIALHARKILDIIGVEE